MRGARSEGMQTVEDRHVDSGESVCNCFWADGSYAKYMSARCMTRTGTRTVS